ncbi:hypothetical protein D9756_008189 [Leucocoprinus leucothites]|uniref:ATP-dependent DNA helicase n=1 Tax=Leucocoprinus leucothites TaxID=201217 RepID=A0A8H5D029_9AGAR|nr:hypothetical protein D9756_008189 [Leucoagaricus leucothites]
MSDYDYDIDEYEDDQLASDDPAFEEVLMRSVVDSHSFHRAQNVASSSATPSSHNVVRNPATNGHKSSSFKPNGVTANVSINGTTTTDGADSQASMAQWVKRQELKRRIAEIDANILGIKESIQSLNTQLSSKESQKEGMVRMLRELDRASVSGAAQSGAGAGSGSKGINYMDGDFDWMGGLKARMRSVFGINDFRLCQRGICNANMDGRDVVVVMPTGGGKSLTYQLPALLTPGCTLVISPLISLITDQILHLQGHGSKCFNSRLSSEEVPMSKSDCNHSTSLFSNALCFGDLVNAGALTGATPTSQKKEITRQLMALAERRVQPGEEEIKLCYVTPEKLAKDTKFVMLLQKLMAAGKLARVVIDEAHCVSQMGHDFRPDYQKLHKLRQLLPSVPIMALSATCPPLVLKDLLKTLRLPDIVDGRNAKSSGTVYFFSPLYRKNLHYRVVPKPSKASDVTKAMVDYILERHPNDSGIVYCLSKKNTETVAQELQELSGGKIRTGVYHADRQESEKSQLHHAWRDGRIKVVCATIAFGLGIDKGDVRFVLHHSMSKSLEGYYQESGRAGRDGKDADCVLYYRPQDGSTIGSMVFNDKAGTEKLHAMLDFAEDLEQCRKIQFAKYFSHSSNLSISSWTTEDQDALERCGHCDNCTRPPETIERRNVSLHTWQLLKIAYHVHRIGGKATVNMLAGLAKNAGGGAFDVSSGGRGKRKEKEKVNLDLDNIAGGTVDLPRDDIEHLIIHLLTKGYFKEEYQQTAYSANVYVVPGGLANRFIHETRENIENRAKPMIEMTLTKQTPKTRGRRKKNAEDEDVDGEDTPPMKKRKTAAGGGTGKRKGKQKAAVNEPIDVIDDEDDANLDHMYVDNPPLRKNQPPKSAPRKRGGGESSEYETIEADVIEDPSDEDSDEVTYDWSTSLRQAPTARRKKKSVGKTSSRPPVDEDEVLVLSSD